MKDKLFILMALFLLGSCELFAQSGEEAERYHQKILGPQVRLLNQNIAYISRYLYDHENRQDPEQRQKLLRFINQGKARLQSASGSVADLGMRSNALEVMEIFHRIVEIDGMAADSLEIPKYINLETLEKYYAMLEKQEAALLRSGNKFRKIQKDYMRKYGIDKSKASCLITKFIEIQQYCRDIYLSQVHLSELGENFFKALKKKQLFAMIEANDIILEESQAIINKLNKISAYEGEGEFLAIAKEYAQFIRKTAEEPFAELIMIMSDENADFRTANKFNAVVIDYHKQHKKLLKQFYNASSSMLQKRISHEADHDITKSQQPDVVSIIAQIDSNEMQEKIRAGSSERVIARVITEAIHNRD